MFVFVLLLIVLSILTWALDEWRRRPRV